MRVEAKDPRTDPSRLDRLAEDRRPELRSVVAGNQNTRPETLLRLAGDPDWRVRSDLASNPATTLDALEQLVNDPDQRVRESLAANANLSPEQLERLAADESWVVRRLIAQREDLSPELLRRLAQSPEPLVGAAVAANLNTPVDELESLAERRELLIDMALARNPHIRARAGDPQANPAVLRALAYHASPDIARQVAANPNTGLRELAFLFRRESLSESVLNNPALNRLSGSHEGLINQELANYAELSDRDRDDLYRRIQSEFKFLEEMRRLRDARRRH